MQRVFVQPRPDWQERLDKIGFYYHSIDGDYWQENACYVFNLAQIETIEAATEQIHQMYLQACADVIQQGDYQRLGFDALQWQLIEQSWKRQDPSLYGRFDFSYDGLNAPKLLEYNADTPTSLFEASVAQWYWLKEQQPSILPAHADQFNSIHERLLVEWRHIAAQLSESHRFDKKMASTLSQLTNKLPLGERLNQQLGWFELTMHFTAVSDSEEDFITCRYLQDTAIQAGLTTEFVDINDIGWDSERQCFVDGHNDTIDHLFKLYPWEFMTAEDFAQHLPTTKVNWLEPAWKLLLSNKAMLAILWEKFPNHPNLLPCYFSADELAKHTPNQVKKPFFSREGANVALTLNGEQQQTTGEYGAEGYVYQACQPLPTFNNHHGQPTYALVGSWIVGNCAAGMGMREDSTLITKDTSLFVPHLFID